MPDPVTTVGIGAIAAYLGKDGVAKILGPTADYLGGELQEFTKKRVDNVGNIFKSAENKLGKRLEEPGSVPPKVLKTIINDGSYSEDQITLEYFGGILASSRTEQTRDDRGARIAKILDNLSCYHIRCHYLIYSTISHVFKNNKHSFRTHEEREKLRIFMPINDFAIAMGFTQDEWDNPQLLPHIFHGLSSDDLITDHWAFGAPEGLKTQAKYNFTEPGIVCGPTATGAELFLWGFGSGNLDLDYVFTDEFSSEIQGIPEYVKNSKAIE